jgi:hypothetical protein
VIDYKALAAPFSAHEIEWRLQQSGEKNGKVWALCVPYVTNRAIMARLDEVVGPENWWNDFRTGPDGGVLCGLTIRTPQGPVTKWDGAPNRSGDPELAIKGGLSGAMKRAAVQWGMGRVLYALDEMFANVHANGNHRGKTREGTFFKWDPPELPKWALPQPASTARAPQPQPQPQQAPERTAQHVAALQYLTENGPAVPHGWKFLRDGQPSADLRAVISGEWTQILADETFARSVARAAHEAINTPQATEG